MQNIEQIETVKNSGRSGVRTQDRPVTCQCCGKAASLASHAFGVEPVELKKINSVSTGNFSQYTCFTKKRMDALGFEPRTDRLWAGCSNHWAKRPKILVKVVAKEQLWQVYLTVLNWLLWPAEVNLSVINCWTFRKTSKQYQNLIPCKQTQNEREGHSRKYPHRPIQIWACHTQTMEVHMSKFHYVASREPELLFFHIALPATAFQYQSLQCAGERTSLLLGLYIIC